MYGSSFHASVSTERTTSAHFPSTSSSGHTIVRGKTCSNLSTHVSILHTRSLSTFIILSVGTLIGFNIDFIRKIPPSTTNVVQRLLVPAKFTMVSVSKKPIVLNTPTSLILVPAIATYGNQSRARCYGFYRVSFMCIYICTY